MEAGIFIVVAIMMAVAIRLAAGGMDQDRVRQYVEARGGRLLSAHWAPFGPGWFGEKTDRIYVVHYVDSDGNEHHAHCKTSLFSGVYFTQDGITRQGKNPADARARSLEEENRFLREELERLKRT